MSTSKKQTAMSSYQYKKPVNKMTFEEVEQQFRADCSELLSPSNHEIARNEAVKRQAAFNQSNHGLTQVQLEIRLNAIYNAVFAEALRQVCGISSWRKWRTDMEQNKPQQVKGHQQKATGAPVDSGVKKSDKMPESWRGKILRDAERM